MDDRREIVEERKDNGEEERSHSIESIEFDKAKHAINPNHKNSQ